MVLRGGVVYVEYLLPCGALFVLQTPRRQHTIFHICIGFHKNNIKYSMCQEICFGQLPIKKSADIGFFTAQIVLQGFYVSSHWQVVGIALSRCLARLGIGGAGPTPNARQCLTHTAGKRTHHEPYFDPSQCRSARCVTDEHHCRATCRTGSARRAA